MNPDTNYIRLRGLPFAAKEQDVRDFLQDTKVFFFGLNAKSITFTLTSNGRASGECYVELDDQEAVKEAQKLDRNEINGRYIEVFSVSDAELLMMIRHGVIKGSGGDADSRYASNFVVRLRGLPYSATVDDIKEFFSGLEVADAVIDKEPGGRPSGEAFVRLATKEYAELALERSKNYMGSRYVEVFRSSADEMDNSYYAARGIPPPTSGPVPLRGISPTLDFRFRDRYGDYGRYGGPIRLSSLHPRPSPYDRPYYDRDRYYRYGARYDPEFDEAMYDPTVKVFMRGLPYSVTTLDIEEFFRPLNCAEIKLGYNEERRLSGDALVTFSTMAEAREALSRNKNNMGTRYIELFPATSIPHPIKTVTFRTVSGTPTRLTTAPRPLYSSFAEDEEASYATGVGGQQYYNDQYEGRQSKYGRDWGEPTRTTW
ncbi:Heterogeneous nuclear ribonucleoprotein [Dirofilaria immitis]